MCMKKTNRKERERIISIEIGDGRSDLPPPGLLLQERLALGKIWVRYLALRNFQFLITRMSLVMITSVKRPSGVPATVVWSCSRGAVLEGVLSGPVAVANDETADLIFDFLLEK